MTLQLAIPLVLLWLASGLSAGMLMLAYLEKQYPLVKRDRVDYFFIAVFTLGGPFSLIIYCLQRLLAKFT